MNINLLNNILTMQLPEGIEFYSAFVTEYCPTCDTYIDINKKLFELRAASGGISLSYICYLTAKSQDKGSIFVEAVEFDTYDDDQNYRYYVEKLKRKIAEFRLKLSTGNARSVSTQGGDLGRESESAI